MKYPGILLLSFIIVFTSIVHDCSADNHERVFRTYKVFSSSMDKLLLDTRYVYIQVSHETNGFYLQNFGPVFTADISLTRNASLPKIVEQWSQWFKHEDGKIIINTKKKPSSPADKNSSGEKSECEKKDEAEDVKRIESMVNSISEFKKEVMETVLDVGPVIQGTNSNDYLAIIFNVADQAFFEKYKTSTLQVQIKMATLSKLSGKSAEDKSVINAFNWNI
ncbi:hypothetical protein K8T06_04700 [bacterium]|nr:hypothetical protein [bacterium]